MTPLQIAVIGILDKADAYEWSVQGFGMLRLYVRKIGRLHIWDSALRYPDVSMVHNHSWDLESVIVFGCLMNTRFTIGDSGRTYEGKRLITGYHTRDVTPLPTTILANKTPEFYHPGDTYTQHATEIHRTDADDGTVTLMRRHEDENGQADVYWLAGTAWGTAKPRRATPEEVQAVVGRVLDRLPL